MKYIPKISAIILAAFAALTLFMTFSIFFDLFGIREMEGNYVLFVVIANFICSLCYFVAAYGFWNHKKWTTQILILAVAVLFIALVSFLIYANSGGLHEPKTTGALIFRLAFTSLFAIVSYKYYNRFSKSN
ncbi:MAG: hypothetical protein IH597_09945 [Bacteroidales bacterium]|nr:hypothetical protein [Bacteroidales bacterium]